MSDGDDDFDDYEPEAPEEEFYPDDWPDDEEPDYGDEE